MVIWHMTYDNKRVNVIDFTYLQIPQLSTDIPANFLIVTVEQDEG